MDTRATVFAVGDLILGASDVRRHFDETRAVLRTGDVVIGQIESPHTNAGHSIAHVLGGFYHIPHGFSCAYALPEIVAFNAVALPEKTKWIGEQLGVHYSEQDTPDEIGEKTKAAMITFRDDVLNIKKANEFPNDPATFDNAAKAIASELFQCFNPVTMDVTQAKEILERIFGR